MSTSFPSAIDDFTNPTSSTPLNDGTIPHHSQHADANDAIEAIETYLLEGEVDGMKGKGGTPDTPDDEFDQGASGLDGKWTVVEGVSGAVNLLETSDVEKYDLTTRPGSLLVQVGKSTSNAVRLRQDYTLPDGASLVLAGRFVVSSAGDTGIANNQVWAGMGINDSDASYDSGERNNIFFDVDDEGWRVIHYYGTTIIGGTSKGGVGGGPGPTGWPGGMLYFRLHRSGDDIYAFVSGSGRAWMPLGVQTRTNPATNVWLFVDANASGDAPAPIQSFEWIRLGGAGVEPW